VGAATTVEKAATSVDSDGQRRGHRAGARMSPSDGGSRRGRGQRARTWATGGRVGGDGGFGALAAGVGKGHRRKRRPWAVAERGSGPPLGRTIKLLD